MISFRYFGVRIALPHDDSQCIHDYMCGSRGRVCLFPRPEGRVTNMLPLTGRESFFQYKNLFMISFSSMAVLFSPPPEVDSFHSLTGVREFVRHYRVLLIYMEQLDSFRFRIVLSVIHFHLPHDD